MKAGSKISNTYVGNWYHYIGQRKLLKPPKGPTICRLPETIGIQIVYFFVMCFACTPYSLVLILHFPKYLVIKGDRFFFRLKIVFWHSFYVQIGLL
jgi:hypothetical protein